MKRFVIGHVTFRPEMRDEFLAMSLSHQAATRAEPGCDFFEIALSLDQPNVAVITECFTSEAAYEVHRATPHMTAMMESMPRLLSEGRFHNIYSDNVVVDVLTFD
jgi:quinol monooxygenase YgiN